MTERCDDEALSAGALCELTIGAVRRTSGAGWGADVRVYRL